MGGTTKSMSNVAPHKLLRALDIQIGKVVWEVPQVGKAESWGGVLSTSGGVVFFCDDSNAFAAVDARTGKRLWQFQANPLWNASPIPYMLDSKHYIPVASAQT